MINNKREGKRCFVVYKDKKVNIILVGWGRGDFTFLTVPIAYLNMHIFHYNYSIS